MTSSEFSRAVFSQLATFDFKSGQKGPTKLTLGLKIGFSAGRSNSVPGAPRDDYLTRFSRARRAGPALNLGVAFEELGTAIVCGAER